jgi:hypothetical protein
VFDAAAELALFRAAPDRAFPIHFTPAKADLRVGELTRLLIKEVDPGALALNECEPTTAALRARTLLGKGSALRPVG